MTLSIQADDVKVGRSRAAETGPLEAEGCVNILSARLAKARRANDFELRTQYSVTPGRY